MNSSELNKRFGKYIQETVEQYKNPNFIELQKQEGNFYHIPEIIGDGITRASNDSGAFNLEKPASLHVRKVMGQQVIFRVQLDENDIASMSKDPKGFCQVVIQQAMDKLYQETGIGPNSPCYGAAYFTAKLPGRGNNCDYFMEMRDPPLRFELRLYCDLVKG